jgi:hypothetical protein
MEFIYHKLVRDPVFFLFQKGPCTRFLPFWCGKPAVLVCAELSKTSQEIWVENSTECDRLLLREVESYAVLLLVVLYVTGLHNVSSLFCAALLKIISYKKNGDKRSRFRILIPNITKNQKFSTLRTLQYANEEKPKEDVCGNRIRDGAVES